MSTPEAPTAVVLVLDVETDVEGVDATVTPVVLVLEGETEGDGCTATPAQRGSLACSASSHGPEMSTPEAPTAVVLVLDVETDVEGVEATATPVVLVLDVGTVIEAGSTWVVDGLSSAEPSNTVAPAVALTPIAARVAAARIVRICRFAVMVISNSVEGCSPECQRARPMRSPRDP